MAKLRCPRCLQTESFGVEHLSSVEWIWDETVHDYLFGVAEPGEPHGGDEATTTCTECMFTGSLQQFHVPPSERLSPGKLGAVALAAALAVPAVQEGLTQALASLS